MKDYRSFAKSILTRDFPSEGRELVIHNDFMVLSLFINLIEVLLRNSWKDNVLYRLVQISFRF